jgi:hypothetical protein
MWRMLEESNSLPCQADLETAIKGENPMLTKFIPTKSDNVIIKEPSLCGKICVKSCFAMVFTALMSPFLICDLYFALTDTSCVRQSFDKLDITMYDYLIVSASFGIVLVFILNCSIICFDFEKKDSKSEFVEMCFFIFGWGLKLFGVSWSIVGFVIFWGYMDTSKCAKPVYNYLLAKFIILVVTILCEISRKRKSKN